MTRLKLLVPAGVAALVLGACGGGSSSGTGVASLGDGDAAASADDSATDEALTEEESEELLLDWTACMREQGVDIPDPTFEDGGGVALGPRGGGDDDGSFQPPDRDAIEAATEACGEPPQGTFGGGPGGADFEELQEQALAFSECMRDEGIDDFPDPDFSDRGPGVVIESGEGDEEVRSAGPFGDIDLDDPDVQAAMEACQDETGGAGPVIRGGPAGGGATGSATAEG